MNYQEHIPPDVPRIGPPLKAVVVTVDGDDLVARMVDLGAPDEPMLELRTPRQTGLTGPAMLSLALYIQGLTETGIPAHPDAHVL